MEKIKIGKGYQPSARGRGFRKNPIVWLINEKLYVKDSLISTYDSDLKGYTMVNELDLLNNGNKSYHSVGIVSEHKKYNKQ